VSTETAEPLVSGIDADASLGAVQTDEATGAAPQVEVTLTRYR
jgi:hypothetical protein